MRVKNVTTMSKMYVLPEKILNLVVYTRLTSEEHAVLSHAHNDLQQLMFQRHLFPSRTLLLRQIKQNTNSTLSLYYSIHATLCIAPHELSPNNMSGYLKQSRDLNACVQSFGKEKVALRSKLYNNTGALSRSTPHMSRANNTMSARRLTG